MTKTDYNSKVKLITVLATVCLFVLVFVIVFQYVRISNLKAEARHLEQSRIEYEASIENYQSKNESRKSRNYVEQYARDEMGMIKDGETLYIFK